MANANQTELLWLRVGDADTYTGYDDLYAVADVLTCYFGVHGVDCWRSHGFEYGDLKNANYVSLYWGDDDAQLIRDLNDHEKANLQMFL